ncbi:MAG: phosphotransferase [Burkholderiales bacterium]|nr:phosphotransferase [Burkholderiales bacterium]MBK8665747.1 phosphotransferase [Burkholderiales bacterium]
MKSTANQGATLVGVVHAFDVDGLARWMHAQLPDFAGSAADLRIEQFQGGQSNPTYRICSGEQCWILRRKPPGKLLPSAHAIEREFRIMQALADTEVPVPRMLGLCEDPAVIGTAFYMMEYLAGRILWEPTLPGMTPSERTAHYAEINRVIAALHTVDVDAIGLSGIGKPGRYIERQIARWGQQYLAGCQEAGAPRISAMDRLLDWMPAHLPVGDESAIAHGDFRLDNLIWHPTEPRVLAVLDWELATLGHPLSDFAYLMLAWRMPPSEFRGMAGATLAELGIPGEADFIADYCRRTGRASIPNFDYYIVFNLFRIAAILHGVWARALGGNASDQNALQTGQRAERLAAAAWLAAKQME